jgi:hypothetical protein
LFENGVLLHWIMGLFGKEYGKLGDERLMELVVRGDERAFAALYDRYHRPPA